MQGLATFDPPAARTVGSGSYKGLCQGVLSEEEQANQGTGNLCVDSEVESSKDQRIKD